MKVLPKCQLPMSSHCVALGSNPDPSGRYQQLRGAMHGVLATPRMAPHLLPPPPGWTAYQLPGGLLLPRQVKTLAYSDTSNEQLCISQAASQRQQAWLT